jgi:hypothetical protein
MSATPHGHEDSRGQSIVEFALILPLLLIMFLAADFGAFNSRNWEGDPGDPTSNYAKTLDQMTERACVAARNLPDYAGPDTGCSNPTIAVELQEPDGSVGVNCDDETRPTPCRVVVTLTHDFHLIVPMSVTLFDVTVGFPPTMTFERTSIFAISDFIIDTAAPTP